MVHVISPPKRTGESIRLAIKKGRLTTVETIEFWLHADSDNPSWNSILSTTGYPIPHAASAEFGLCKTSECKKVTSRLYSITATFESDVEDDTNQSRGSDPTAWVPQRETNLEPYQEVRLTDLDNKAYTNGAGVPFASAPAIDMDMIRWDFFQFEPETVTDEQVSLLNNTINNQTYKGKAKHTLLLKVRKSTIGTYFGTRLRATEYSLLWKPSTWLETMANVGNSFLLAGKAYPYRYLVKDSAGVVDKAASEAIHVGPLGSRNVPYNTNFTAADGLPAGGTEVFEGKTYAVKLTTPTLYYIHRRRHEELDMATKLKI